MLPLLLHTRPAATYNRSFGDNTAGLLQIAKALYTTATTFNVLNVLFAIYPQQFKEMLVPVTPQDTEQAKVLLGASSVEFTDLRRLVTAQAAITATIRVSVFPAILWLESADLQTPFFCCRCGRHSAR